MPNARKYDERQREAILSLADSGVSSPEIARRLAAGEGPVPPVDIPQRTVRRIVFERRQEHEWRAARLGGSGGRANDSKPALASGGPRTSNFLHHLVYLSRLDELGISEYAEERPDDGRKIDHDAAVKRAQARAAAETDLGAASPHHGNQ